jgi:hypothetical protein
VLESTIHICLVCRGRLEPDETVVEATHESSESIGGEEVTHRETRFAHPSEAESVTQMGWRVTATGILRELRRARREEVRGNTDGPPEGQASSG